MKKFSGSESTPIHQFSEPDPKRSGHPHRASAHPWDNCVPPPTPESIRPASRKKDKEKNETQFIRAKAPRKADAQNFGDRDPHTRQVVLVPGRRPRRTREVHQPKNGSSSYLDQVQTGG